MCICAEANSNTGAHYLVDICVPYIPHRQTRSDTYWLRSFPCTLQALEQQQQRAAAATLFFQVSLWAAGKP
jgi:hypothetical protein